MLQMNLITQKELYVGLWAELFWKVYGELRWELYDDLYEGLYKEVYLELWELGTQIRIDFHNSKFRGYNTVC
jgi:hypothetical protein